ncbi:MAG: metallophosphoesterase, partial [Polyangiaceae bacterium]|nr:metallophosphoesterase [Polyangiaceae bacterium]
MPTAPSGLTLVHLSDLQFGRNHRFGRLGLASPDDTFDSLLSRVTTDFSLLSRESGLKPDAVVVTGDIAEHAKPSEYRDASSFVTGVLNHLGLALDRLIVVPGNHDISRSACEAYFKHCESVEETPAAPFYPKWQNFAAFLDATFGAPARFTPLATWSVHPIDSLGVVFACMNSTVRESH